MADGFALIDLPTFPAGTPLQFEILAIFDPKTCMLSGANSNHEKSVADVFHLKYDGEKLSGPAAATLKGKLLVPVTYLETLIYLE